MNLLKSLSKYPGIFNKLSTSTIQEPRKAFRMCWWSGNLEKKEKKKEKKREKEEKREIEGREGKDSNFKYLCTNLVSNRRRPAIDDDAQPHHTILC